MSYGTYRIPKVDNYEASIPVMPRDLRVGDRIATGWCSHDTVQDVELVGTRSARITLRSQGGGVYEATRFSPVPVIQD